MAILCSSGCEHDDNGNVICRTYATQYESYGTGITNGFPNIQIPITVNCLFDRNLLLLTCAADYMDQYGQNSRIIKTRGYASTLDFINEASVVGKILARSYALSNNGLSPDSIIHVLFGDGMNTFDEQNRLVSTDNLHYISWDQLGRPTASAPTGICTTDTGVRYVYNDAQRIVTKYANTRTLAGPMCIPVSWEIEFDAHGNVVRLSSNSSSSNTYYEIIAEEEVCMNEK
jgi:hypothetical protein